MSNGKVIILLTQYYIIRYTQFPKETFIELKYEPVILPQLGINYFLQHVVFGSVVEGMDVLKQIERVGSQSGKTSYPVKVEASGQL